MILVKLGPYTLLGASKMDQSPDCSIIFDLFLLGRFAGLGRANDVTMGPAQEPRDFEGRQRSCTGNPWEASSSLPMIHLDAESSQGVPTFLMIVFRTSDLEYMATLSGFCDNEYH